MESDSREVQFATLPDEPSLLPFLVQQTGVPLAILVVQAFVPSVPWSSFQSSGLAQWMEATRFFAAAAIVGAALALAVSRVIPDWTSAGKTIAFIPGGLFLLAFVEGAVRSSFVGAAAALFFRGQTGKPGFDWS